MCTLFTWHLQCTLFVFRTVSNITQQNSSDGEEDVAPSTSASSGVPPSHGSEYFVRSSDGRRSSSSSSSCLGGARRKQEEASQPAQAAKKAKVGIEQKLLEAFEANHDDAETSFCMSLVSQLKRLDPRTQAVTRLRIQQLLFDAEFSNGSQNMSHQNGFQSAMAMGPPSVPPPPAPQPFQFTRPLPPMTPPATPVHSPTHGGMSDGPSVSRNERPFQNQALYDVMEYHAANLDKCQNQ